MLIRRHHCIYIDYRWLLFIDEANTVDYEQTQNGFCVGECRTNVLSFVNLLIYLSQMSGYINVQR